MSTINSERDDLVDRSLGRYRILERLGAGGMGVVYRARDERLDRDVALKVLPPGRLTDEDARRRFKKEALALSRTNHPQIATIHDFDADGGVDFLVMEYIPGKGLDQVAAEGPLSDERVRELGMQLADGLVSLHQHGMVHRDLKPGNLRLTPDGRVKILDFGLARFLQPITGRATETSDSGAEFAGTLPYMAPEQIKGETVDERTDIYAAGAVLYELATGRPLFPGAGRGELVGAILGRIPAKPKSINPNLSDSLERTIVRALSKDPEKRPATATALRDALAQRGDGPWNDSAREPAPRERKAAVGVIGAVLALLALVVIATVVIQRFQTRPAAPIAAPAKISVAVLPFHALSVSQPIRFLGIGLPDAIITRLAGVERLAPRPTSAILRYENETVDPKDAGRALKSDYVLTGILQEADNRLRVSVQLVRAEDGTAMWGNHYDVARSDLLGLQDQLARAVAEALKVQMTAAERERLLRRYTENAAAYERYLEGRALLSRATAESVRASIDAFEDALKVDPNYAPARAGVALASGTMRIRFSAPAEASMWADRAEREAQAALKLDPQLAEAHEALAGVYRAIEFKWEETIEEGRLALALNPNLDQPHLYRAAAFYHLGLLDLVEPELLAAADVNPLSQPVKLESERARGITALFAGRFQEARQAFEAIQKEAAGTAGNWLLGQSLYYTGDVSRATELMNLPGGSPGDRRSQAALASVRAAQHADAEARALAQGVLDGGFIDHHIDYSLGAAFAQLGDFVEARKHLDTAAKTGFPCYPWFARDPLLDPIRRDPDFIAFLSGLEDSWRKRQARYTSATR